MSKEARAKIVGVGTLRVRTKFGSKGVAMRRKVLTNGIIEKGDLAEEIKMSLSDIGRLMDGIKRIARAGYEVRLHDSDGGYVRFFPCLDTDYKTMYLSSQTCGTFRDAVSDLKFNITHRDEELESDEAEARSVEHREESKPIEVKPDTVIECPKCGTKIRVGRSLDGGIKLSQVK